MTIKDFFKGQSLSPYTTNGAFDRCKNIDITSQPGVLKCGIVPVNIGSTLNLMTSWDTDTTGVHYLAGTARAYSLSANLATLTNITGTGGSACGAFSIKYWEAYLIASISNKLRYSATATPDTWGDFAVGEPTTLTSLNYPNHELFKSEWNGTLYVTNGQKIASLVKVGATFDPTDDTTYAWTADAFTLPSGFTAYSISEIDNLLVIAAYQTLYSKTFFFFWNRADTTAEFIYDLAEPGIHSLNKIGRDVIATGGYRGNFYKVSLYGVKLWKTIPHDTSVYAENLITSMSLTSGIALWDNNLMAGVSNDAAGITSCYCGIYSIGDEIHHAFCPSTGIDGSADQAEIGAIFNYKDTLIFGWRRTTGAGATTYGIDKIDYGTYRQTGYATILESNVYPVGVFAENKSFDRVNVQLGQAMATGQGVCIKYRKNIGDSWTTLGTRDYATNGAISSLDYPGIHNCENLQIRVELTTGASSRTTPSLKEVHLI